MNRNLSGGVVLLVASVAGCATSPAGWASRGTVSSTAPGSRAIVAGPATLHAYAGFGGGAIYGARAATGTDADCAGAQSGAAAVPLPADRVVSVTVPAGEIACLRTETVTGYELLWHAQAQPGTSSDLAARAGNDVQRQ